MVGPFLISVREGLEMALIVAIVLAYLNKTGNRSQFRSVWLGLAAAVAASVGAGGLIFFIAGKLSGEAEAIFEGAAMLFAVAVITWMVFWMRSVSRNIKRELEGKVDSALEAGSRLALVSLVFVAVVREGLEEALFLFSASQTSSAGQSIVGALLGLSVAALLGYAVYAGSRRLNLRAFFNATSIVLIIVAAGLLAHGLHEFMEVGLVPAVVEHVWDVNWIIDEKGTVGLFLKALIGYNGNPALVEAAAYFVYIFWAVWAFVRPMLGTEERNSRAHASAA